MTASETTALLAAPGRAGRRWSAGTWAVVVTAALASAAVLALVLLVGPAATAGGPAAVDGHRLEQPFVGRYLHITDMHVDLQYREGSTAYSFCHRKPPQQQQQQLLSADDGHRHTGRYGFAMSKCDSPVALVNITRDYMASTWADNVDFVMWTGDSGRHDRDLDRPRTFGDIVDGNRIAAAALQSAFPRTPIVPNVGNNDVSPHNELPGPGHKRARKTFKSLARAWKNMVPKDQMATFLYGGYFARDLVDYSADSLSRGSRGITALSLNTIYWYRANSKVGGCRANDSPGLAQLAWVRYQLRIARKRKRDVILMGHVMPTRENYRPTCYHGYARTITQIVPVPGDGDTLPIVHAQLFGHSNIDAWAFVGHEGSWLGSPEPLGNGNNTSTADDNRLWWERQVDDEEGRFGELIRDVWSVKNADPDTHVFGPGERHWEKMEDDPPVRFVEHSDGSIWPAALHTDAPAAQTAKQLPSDFVDDLLGEFKRVLAQESHHPRLSVSTISPSIIPTYYPAFRIVHYLRGVAPQGPWGHLPRGTMVDYDVYWADLPTLNSHPPHKAADFFKRLYRFSTVYGIGDLSVDGYLKWARKLVTSKSLRKKFRSLTFLNSA